MVRIYWGRGKSRKHGTRKVKNRLVNWLTKHHPGVKYLHQITPSIAEEYAPHVADKPVARVSGDFAAITLPSGCYMPLGLKYKRRAFLRAVASSFLLADL